MKDILGREIKDGDMCIGMAIGRNSHGMHIGVFQGSSVVYLSSYSGGSLNKSCTSNTYLIENPTDQELEIKEKILKVMKEQKEKVAALKTIPLSKLEVGGIYKSTQGVFYVYLGKRRVIFEDMCRSKEDVKEGNCFVYISLPENKTDEEIVDQITRINSYRGESCVNVLKGNKKLVEMVRKVDLTFPLVNEVKNIWRDHFRLIIE